MSYELVFDVATADVPGWQFIGVGVALTAVGAALVFAPALMHRLAPEPDGLQGSGCFSWFFFLFSLTWTLVAVGSTLIRHVDLRDASINGDCAIVAGVVSDFVPMPYEGHAMESFAVDGVRFEYSDYVVTGGFNHTRSHGGPIEEGLPVRICYVRRDPPDRNIIVRLEVAR